MLRFYWFWVVFLSALRLYGQHAEERMDIPAQHQFAFEHFSQESGLSQGSVYTIASYDGYMWFGTQDGLNRFDGYNFKTFRKKLGVAHSLTNSWVQDLLADSKGRFWIGTAGGLCLYDVESEQFRRFGETVNARQLLDSVSIEKLIEDRRGNIWVMTDERGVFRIDPRDGSVHAYLPGNNKLYGFCLDAKGSVLLSSYDEIYQFDSQRNILHPLGIKKKLRKYLSEKSLIQSVLVDTQGNMWVGTYQEGVFRIKKPFADGEISHFVKGRTNYNITSNEIRDFLEDRNGRIWMGTKGGGISIFDYEHETITHLPGIDARNNGLGENHVMELFQDRQGIIWIGLSYNGIDKYDPAKHIFRNIRRDGSGARNGSVFTIYNKEDNLYLGTADKLVAYSIPDQRFNRDLERKFSGVSLEVYNMSEDADGNLWMVSTDKGLFRFDSKKGYVPYTNRSGSDRLQYFLYSVKAIKSAPEIWVGGHRGVERFDLKSQKWKDWNDVPSMKAAANRTIRVMYEDSRKNVWLGTLGYGLFRYNAETRQVAGFDKNNGLMCENIRSMLEVGTTLWIGTDCGLFQLDLNRLTIINHYSETTAAPFNLPNEVIYGILTDNQGYLWLSSNKGLAKFSSEKGVLKTYDVTDGLQSNEFNTSCAYKHRDGTLYFGGVNGISYVNPGDLRENVFVPPVKITGITISDSIYPPGLKEITLRHDQNFIDFEFTALNFSNTRKNQYQYQMEGIDSRWVHSGVRRMASYTNLPVGNYVFKVIGSNSDGVWNHEGASVSVTILPPWWATSWFRAFLLGLIAAGIYALFRYRLARQLQQRESEIRASLMAQEEERQRFSRELHDGIGANLSLLKMYISSFGDTNIPLNELKDRTEKLLAGSVDEIRRLIHDMHPRNLKEMGLVKAVGDMVSLVNLGNSPAFSFTASEIPEHLPGQVEINVFRIVQELFQNAIKHSGAKSVWLDFRCEEKNLIITYRDNGIGFDTAAARNGNGLPNIKNRVLLLKGEFTSKSGPGGTFFTIRIPVL